ncbi:putative MFS transporter [Actinoplanes missouriensis 431]|uniref:Putative MFS transporter n=1 Tax=Actinoplanes missouriensis (strain ATCC 14538 / DSM 43046 / CBS 188.64 / JCM 3121 / NBRC 102363 / NCIMB 12654 / NRRL B-3342 / UNCC 431) TaxID=512565 RepID=I0GXZ6_ACTM4|nr:DHA2 family efflux MFS transporter permease subunit [Actinoplanes missouriensis]BAL85633.1 putative MFS transporter [Actinoplanes missouriensis 431]
MSPVRYGTPAGRWILLAMVLGSSLAFIDATIVNLALPTIARELGAEASGLQWIVNGYALSLASLVLLGGSLGDRFGRRRVFQTGVAWFALASLLCGLAPNAEILIAARVLQGVGGALLTPGALAILEASFVAEDRAKAIGAWSGLGGIGGALGPLLGGWLLELGSWRALFLINVPAAALVIAMTARHVPESSDQNAARRIDVAGVLSSAIGLGGLTYGFTAWPSSGPDDPAVVLSLAVGVLALAAFVLIEARSADAMLPIRIFRTRAFSGANLVTFLVYAANGGVFFLLVLNLQVVSGYPALTAGLALLPMTLLMLTLSARAGALGQRIGPRVPMTAGPLICAAGLLMMSTIGPGAPYWTRVLPAVLVFGLGLTLLVAPLTATALGALDDAYAGIASGVNNAVARAAGLLAVAVLPLAAGLGGGSLTEAATLEPVYQRTMLICAGLMVAGSLVAYLTVPGRAPTRRTPAHTFCDPASPPVHR